ncbi:MAG: outer membrane protein TolC [Gammaproteobacteria bacterium]|jgi:outer membrane protein TolC
MAREPTAIKRRQYHHLPGVLDLIRYGVIFFLFGSYCLLSKVSAEIVSDLPEPLTLAAALATADNVQHPDIFRIDQKISEAFAQIKLEASSSDFRLDFNGRIRQVGPSSQSDQDETGDSLASLVLSKPVYDFGLTNIKTNQLTSWYKGLESEKKHIVVERRLVILEQYFEVLNADNEFISSNEALALGFIRFDRARDGRQLGTTSDIDVLKLQAEYETIRQRRYFAVNQQRFTRQKLALLMGYPDHLASNLEKPDVNLHIKVKGELAEMLTAALKYSPEAEMYRNRILAFHHAIAAAENTHNAKLDFELELSEYERDSATRDEWRASLYFKWPLFGGSISTTLGGVARSQYHQIIAEYQAYEAKLRIELLELWQRMSQQQLVARGFAIEEDYRDLYLDRSRAEYELEFKTDLGDAMVEFSNSRTLRLKAEYGFELAYQRLKSLVGPDYFIGSANTGRE